MGTARRAAGMTALLARMPAGLIYSAALAIASGLNFVALIAWTRLLPPAAFGVYALVSGTALFLNAAAFDWLRLTTARLLVEPGARFGVSATRSNAMALVVLVAVVIFVAVVAGVRLLHLEIAGLAPSWWPVIGIYTLSEMALALTNTLSRFRLLPWQYFRSMVVRGALSLAIGVPLVTIGGWGAAGAIGGIVIAQWIVCGISMALDPFWRTLRPGRGQKAEVNAILRFGMPLIASSGATYAVGFVDRYMVGQMLGLKAVGLYAAPFDLMQKTIVFLMLAINLTAFPRIVHAFERDGADIARKLLSDNFLLQIGLGAPAVAGLIALAPGLSGLLLGPAFRASATVLLPVIAIAVMFRCLIGFHVSMAFQLAKRTRLMIVAPALSVAILIAGGYIGLRWFGLIGMAWAAAAAQGIAYLVSIAMARRIFGLGIPARGTLTVLAAALAMGLCLWPLRDHATKPMTVLLVAGGGCVYALILLLLRFAPMLWLVAKVRRLATRGHQA